MCDTHSHSIYSSTVLPSQLIHSQHSLIQPFTWSYSLSTISTLFALKSLQRRLCTSIYVPTYLHCCLNDWYLATLFLSTLSSWHLHLVELSITHFRFVRFETCVHVSAHVSLCATSFLLSSNCFLSHNS
jgi:hypothetical protein